VTAITPISNISVAEAISSAAAPKQAAGSGFGAVLNNAIQQVEGSRTEANQSVQRLLGGDSEELHTTVLATQKAELEFEMMVQVRNKVVSAYQEIMRMQV
jgi:flagellar hook-basal body complex protein FliE